MLKISVNILLAVLVCFAAPKKYGNSKYWKTVQLKAANCYAADVGVPVVIGSTGMLDVISTCNRSDGKDIIVTNVAGVLIPRDLAGFGKTATIKFQLWYKDPATSATPGGTQVYLQWGGTSVNVANDATTWADCYGGSTDHALVAHCEEASANLTDASGNYTATDANLTYAQTGKIRLGAEFNGNNSISSWGDITQLNSVQKFTIMIWFAQDVIDVGDVIFRKLSGGNLIDCETAADGNLYLQIGSNANYGYFDYSTVISAGNYHKMDAVYDGTLTGNSNKLKTFVDKNSITLSFVGTIESTTPNYSGASFNFGRTINSFDGKIDEFRIVAGALTANQISCQYDIQNGFATNATLTIGSTKKFGNLHKKIYLAWQSWMDWSRRCLRY